MPSRKISRAEMCGSLRTPSGYVAPAVQFAVASSAARDRKLSLRRWVLGLVAVALASMAFGAQDVWAGAIISNGTVKLGVNDAGDLNYSDPMTGESRGVTYIPTDSDGTRAGCLCEG